MSIYPTLLERSNHVSVRATTCHFYSLSNFPTNPPVFIHHLIKHDVITIQQHFVQIMTYMLLLSVQVYFVTNVELIIPVTLSLHVVFDSFVKEKPYKLKLCCVIFKPHSYLGYNFLQNRIL